jgi:hypothetical protein
MMMRNRNSCFYAFFQQLDVLFRPCTWAESVEGVCVVVGGGGCGK